MTLIFRIFKNLKKLKPFVTEQGRIFPRRITGLTTKQQRGIKKNIKQFRSFYQNIVKLILDNQDNINKFIRNKNTNSKTKTKTKIIKINKSKTKTKTRKINKKEIAVK